MDPRGGGGRRRRDRRRAGQLPQHDGGIDLGGGPPQLGAAPGEVLALRPRPPERQPAEHAPTGRPADGRWGDGLTPPGEVLPIGAGTPERQATDQELQAAQGGGHGGAGRGRRLRRRTGGRRGADGPQRHGAQRARAGRGGPVGAPADALVGPVEHVDQPGQRQPRTAPGQVGGSADGRRTGLVAMHLASCHVVVRSRGRCCGQEKGRDRAGLPRPAATSAGGRVTEPLRTPPDGVDDPLSGAGALSTSRAR